MKYEIQLHPLCTLFPPMANSEFAELKADLAKNGLQKAIVRYEGKILDGAHRYRACVSLDIEPLWLDVEGTYEHAVSFVLSANLHRRHLSAGQRAAIVALATNWVATAQAGDNQHPIADEDGRSANLSRPKTIADRQQQSGVSRQTQKDADKIAKADPELVRQVAAGEKTLPKAVEELTGKRPGATPPVLKVVSDELTELRAENDRLKEWGSENAQTAKDLIADNESMAVVFEADDKLAVALAEAKKYREMNRILEARIVGLMNEKNEAVRAAKMWQRKAEKLEKAV